MDVTMAYVRKGSYKDTILFLPNHLWNRSPNFVKVVKTLLPTDMGTVCKIVSVKWYYLTLYTYLVHMPDRTLTVRLNIQAAQKP